MAWTVRDEMREAALRPYRQKLAALEASADETDRRAERMSGPNRALHARIDRMLDDHPTPARAYVEPAPARKSSTPQRKMQRDIDRVNQMTPEERRALAVKLEVMLKQVGITTQRVSYRAYDRDGNLYGQKPEVR